MKKLIIGIVDYALGNHASVRQALMSLGYRCHISDDPAKLACCDMLVLPGVGAFPPAMSRLVNKGLDDFLIDTAYLQKPILGICLGMQLLAQSSLENGKTCGLGLIPGKIIPLGEMDFHIGWNTVELTNFDPLFEGIHEKLFYYNHSYIYEGADEFQIGHSYSKRKFPSIIKKNNIIGVQFHPEKSQSVGQLFLRDLIEGLCNA